MRYRLVLVLFLLFSIPILASPNAYVCDYGTNAVSVIDTTTNSIVATVSAGIGAAQSALTPDGNYLYVANAGEYSVSVIDTVHNILYDTINFPATGGSFPADIAITPDGKYAYVPISGDNTTNNVTVIDIATNSIVTVINFPHSSYPDTIGITRDGKYAYVFGHNHLYVVSTQTNSIVGNPIGGFDQPYSIVFSPDGSYAYVAGDHATIDVIDTSSYAVSYISVVGTGSSGAGLGGICISPDGFYLYVVNVTHPYVYVVDTRSKQKVASILSPFSILEEDAITADGGHVYFSGNFGVNPGKIGIIDTKSNSITGTIDIAGISSPVSITINPSPPPLPPTNFEGVQKINNFAVAQEHFNALSWTPSLSVIAGYNLSRNGQLIATLSPTTVTYQDHNRPLNQNTTYTLRAFNDAGSISYASTIEVLYAN